MIKSKPFFTELIIEILKEIILTAKKIIITCYIKNPCKSNKCLVRSCCTKYCEKQRNYSTYTELNGKIWFLKLTSISIVFLSVLMFIIIIYRLL